jgi:acyl transferase domain-containing protein
VPNELKKQGCFADIDLLQVVVDSFLSPVPVFHEPQNPSKPELLLFSANTPASLKETVERYTKFVHENAELMPSDMAYTLSMRREKLTHRTFAILENNTLSDISSQVKTPVKSPEIYLIFSGQGAQWPRMGAELLISDPLFKKDIRMMDQTLQTLAYPPAWSIHG